MVLTTLRRRRTLLGVVTTKHAPNARLMSLIILSVVFPCVLGLAAHKGACERPDQAVAHLMTAVATCYTASESSHETALALLSFGTALAGCTAIGIVWVRWSWSLVVGALLGELVLWWVVSAAALLRMLWVVLLLLLAVLRLVVLVLVVLRLVVVTTVWRLLSVVESTLIWRTVGLLVVLWMTAVAVLRVSAITLSTVTTLLRVATLWWVTLVVPVAHGLCCAAVEKSAT